MTRSWDHRQLVKARGELSRAVLQAQLAIDRLEQHPLDTEIRVLFAVRHAETALTELRRFARRHGQTL